MNINPSPKVRLVIYLASGIGALVVAYLQSKGYIGETEVALWAGVVALVNGLSAYNVSK